MLSPRFALVLAPLLLVAPHSACSSSPEPAGPNPAYADVIFESPADPDALTALLADKAVDDPAHAAFFDNPKDLTALPGTPIITFAWHDGQTASLQLLPRPARAASFTGVLSDLLGERTAHAQGPTLTGTGYLLVFSTLDTNQELFRVFTGATTYTPDATAWAKIATGNWTTLQITSAGFAADALTDGPYSGQVVKFCIGDWQ